MGQYQSWSQNHCSVRLMRFNSSDSTTVQMAVAESFEGEVTHLTVSHYIQMQPNDCRCRCSLTCSPGRFPGLSLSLSTKPDKHAEPPLRSLWPRVVPEVARTTVKKKKIK